MQSPHEEKTACKSVPFQGILLSPSTPSCLKYDLILHSVTATCKEEKFSTFSEKQKTKIHPFLKTFIQFLKIAISDENITIVN